jgi:hypothetical protein
VLSPFLLQVVASGITPGGLFRVTANPEIIPGQKSALGEAQCQRMPTQPRVPRSPFVDNFRLADIQPKHGESAPLGYEARDWALR